MLIFRRLSMRFVLGLAAVDPVIAVALAGSCRVGKRAEGLCELWGH